MSRDGATERTLQVLANGFDIGDILCWIAFDSLGTQVHHLHHSTHPVPAYINTVTKIALEFNCIRIGVIVSGRHPRCEHPERVGRTKFGDVDCAVAFEHSPAKQSVNLGTHLWIGVQSIGGIERGFFQSLPNQTRIRSLERCGRSNECIVRRFGLWIEEFGIVLDLRQIGRIGGLEQCFPRKDIAATLLFSKCVTNFSTDLAEGWHKGRADKHLILDKLLQY